MASVRAMGWEEALDAEDSDVRERRVRLRRGGLARWWPQNPVRRLS